MTTTEAVGAIQIDVRWTELAIEEYQLRQKLAYIEIERYALEIERNKVKLDEQLKKKPF